MSKKNIKIDESKNPIVKNPETPIVDRIIEFFNMWANHDEAYEDGSRPISKHQLIVCHVTFEFAFKWYVSKDEFIEAAKHIEEELEPEQTVLKMGIGEYNIELEIYNNDQ